MGREASPGKMSGSVCTPAETAIRGSTRKQLTDNIPRMFSDDKRQMDYVFGSDRMTRFLKDCTKLDGDEGGNDVPKTDSHK
jgi:hypothetical protein